MPVRIMRCGRSKGPCIIGKAGATIKAIRETSGVHKIEWRDDNGLVEITGGSQRVLDKAEEIITEVMRGDESTLGKSTIDIGISPAVCNFLLGCRGKTM